MTGDEKLATAFLEAHPIVAARLLESMDASDAVEVLQSTYAKVAAPVLHHMLPAPAARCAEQLPAAYMAALLEQLPSLSGAALLRQFSPAARIEAMRRVGKIQAGALKLLLRYPPEAIGAWMEPRVLTIPDDCSVREATARMEREEHARPNVYVLDRARKLRGFVRQLTLMRTRQRGPITALLEPIEALWARESVARAQEREVWERESEAPLVNRHDEFVGVVTYADLRRGQQQLARTVSLSSAHQDFGEFTELLLNGLDSTWQSLGELFGTYGNDRTGTGG